MDNLQFPNGQDLTAFEQHVVSFLDEFQPEGITEENLVRVMACATWLAKQIVPVEMAITHPTAGDTKTLGKQIRVMGDLDRVSDALHRTFHSTLALLRRLQELRGATSRKPATRRKPRKPSFTADGMTVQ